MANESDKPVAPVRESDLPPPDEKEGAAFNTCQFDGRTYPLNARICDAHRQEWQCNGNNRWVRTGRVCTR